MADATGPFKDIDSQFLGTIKLSALFRLWFEREPSVYLFIDD